MNHSFTELRVFGGVENIVSSFICAILITVGFVVNIYIVYIFLARNAMNSIFGRFLLHLCLIDLGQYIGITPYFFLSLKKVPSLNKYFESFLCSVTDGQSGMLIFSMGSCILLTFLSIMRCESINNRSKRWVSEKNVTSIFTLTWGFGSISFIPFMLSYKLDHRTGFCFRQWIFEEPFGTLYMSMLYLCGLMIPLSVMIVVCVTSYAKLYSKDLRGNVVLSIRKKVIIRLCALVAIYTMGSFPYSIYWLMMTTSFFQSNLEGQSVRLKVLRYILVPALLKTVLVPLLVARNNGPFRSSGNKNCFKCWNFSRMKKQKSSMTLLESSC